MCMTVPDGVDMNRLYRRNTHTPQGQYRQGMRAQWDKIPDIYAGLVHDLESDKFLDIHDVLSNIFRYAADYPFENGVGEFGDPVKLQTSLEQLAIEDMVEAINADELFKGHIQYMNKEQVDEFNTREDVNFLGAMPSHGWYFWDETSDWHGPYQTREEANRAIDKYARDLLSSL